ncbi:hypothetical protein MLAC_04510 [Mycobacterium lacus]|uniref:Uncharacterized protein n=1 Tax=Mycobacterium lacus TaxID=169765 RepID=A0A7I7NI33_9MYCO|nr:hypothetical protein MLAC_04510 [Mycobacterium lacus]
MARLPRIDVARGKLAQAEQLLNPEQEAGTADPTDQNGDLHSARQYLPAAMRQRADGSKRKEGKRNGRVRRDSSDLK